MRHLIDFCIRLGHSSAVNIVQITPGAGGMYCGNCFRDNALVTALRQMGHAALMVPVYLPLKLDESDQSAGVPIFFGGVNVYLDQKLALHRKLPTWLRRWLDSPALLRWAGGRAAKTRAEDVGDLLFSMLRGEDGNQSRELDELIAWLQAQPQRPDVICLSNALLLGMARQLRSRLRVPVVCMLQGEDSFLDALPDSHRERAWQALRERATEADLFIGPSRYYAEVMRARLRLPEEQVRVVYNGISLDGYRETRNAKCDMRNDAGPVLGYFARMCREKGLDLLMESFIQLKRRGRVPTLQLRVGGSCGPSDEPLVNQWRERLRAEGLADDVTFHPNLERSRKIEFYRSLTVFSVPALYGEAFGLYLLEALACGVPAVQPRCAAFPELIAATGGGLVCDPVPLALAETIEHLLLDPGKLRALGEAGRRSVFEQFSVEQMATNFLAACGQVAKRNPVPGN